MSIFTKIGKILHANDPDYERRQEALRRLRKIKNRRKVSPRKLFKAILTPEVLENEIKVLDSEAKSIEKPTAIIQTSKPTFSELIITNNIDIKDKRSNWSKTGLYDQMSNRF